MSLSRLLVLTLLMMFVSLAPAAEQAAPAPRAKGSRRTNFAGSAQNWALTRELTRDEPLLQTWNPEQCAGFAPQDLVPDSDGSDGKSVLLRRDGSNALSWTIDFPRDSYYAIFVRARSDAQYDSDRDRVNMTCTVGDLTIRMRLNYLDQHEYVTHFRLPIRAAGARQVTVRLATPSALDLYVDLLELRDVLGNCPRGAFKQQQTLYTAQEIAELRRGTKVEKPSPRSTAERAARDAQLWAIQTSPYLPISAPISYEPMVPAINPKTGQPAKWQFVDPVLEQASHGWPVPADAAPLPSDRFKVRDANTGMIFPSNDYAAGDLSSGDFPDDGWGWDARQHSQNEAVLGQAFGSNVGMYYFVASHTIHSWRYLESELLKACQSYLETGDPEFAHDGAVLLAELANVYPIFDFNVQAQRNMQGESRWLPWAASHGGWLYSSWQAAALARIARAYDQLFPYLNDPQAVAGALGFVHSQLPHIQTAQDLRALIETNLLQYPSDQAIRRHLAGANGGWEYCVATLLAVQQDPRATQALAQELWTRAFMSNLNQGGVQDVLVNEGLRDGSNEIGQANYAAGWLAFPVVAELLERYVNAGGDPRYRLTTPAQRARLVAAGLFPIDVRGAGGFQTNVGEGYTTPRDTIRQYPERQAVIEQRAAYRMSFEQAHDPRAAAMLQLLKRAEEPDSLWSAVEAAAAPFAGNPFRFNRTRALHGFGLLYLEAGVGADDLTHQRAAVLRTGIGYGHADPDDLDLELYAHGMRVLPDLGMRYTKPDSRRTRMHNVVEIDGRDFINGPSHAKGTSYADQLVDAGWVRYAEAHGRAKTLPQVREFRRAVVLVDVSPSESYTLDVFTVTGGNQHMWCFHGPVHRGFAHNASPVELDDAWQKYLNGYAQPSAGVAPAILETRWQAATGDDVHLTSRLLNVEGLAVGMGGGVSFKDMDFVHVRRTGQDLQSRWTQVLEPYQGQPFIEKVIDRSTAAVAAVEIVTRYGQRDLLCYNPTPKQPCTVAGITFTGRLAVVRRDAGTGKLRQLLLAGGSALQVDQQALTLAGAEQRAVVTGFDEVSNTVTLDAPVRLPTELDRLCVVGSAPRAVPFQVTAVDAEGRQLKLLGSPRVFQSPAQLGSGVTVKLALPLALRRADPDYYLGAALHTERGQQQSWRVVQTPDHQTLVLDRELSAADLVDADGDGQTYIYLDELTVGDALTIPTYAAVELNDAGAATLSGDQAQWKRTR